MANDSQIRRCVEKRVIGTREQILVTAEPSFEGRPGKLFVTDRRIVFGTEDDGSMEFFETPGSDIEDVGAVEPTNDATLQILHDQFKFESSEDRELIEQAIKAQFVDGANVSLPRATGRSPWWVSDTSLLFVFYAFWPVALYGLAQRMLGGRREDRPFWHHPFPLWLSVFNSPIAMFVVDPVWLGLVTSPAALLGAYGFTRRIHSEETESPIANYVGLVFASCSFLLFGFLGFTSLQAILQSTP
jgi:hypothetical protein